MVVEPAAAEWCDLCQRPMVMRRHVWVCPDCDLIRIHHRGDDT